MCCPLRSVYQFVQFIQSWRQRQFVCFVCLVTKNADLSLQINILPKTTSCTFKLKSENLNEHQNIHTITFSFLNGVLKQSIKMFWLHIWEAVILSIFIYWFKKIFFFTVSDQWPENTYDTTIQVQWAHAGPSSQKVNWQNNKRRRRRVMRWGWLFFRLVS